MVSALESGSSSPRLSPGRGTALCSWTRHVTLMLPLSTQVYKRGPVNLTLEVTLRWTSIPSRKGGGRGRNTPSRFMLQKPGLVPTLRDGPLGSYAELTFHLASIQLVFRHRKQIFQINFKKRC